MLHLPNDFDKKISKRCKMGGSGSGSWYRWDSKKTTESQYKIDIRWMKKEVYLYPGTMGALSWTCWDEESEAISFRTEPDKLVPTCRSRQNDGEWEEIENSIYFTWPQCNFWCRRQWFLCPECQRRLAIVYGAKYYRTVAIAITSPASQQESKRGSPDEEGQEDS